MNGKITRINSDTAVSGDLTDWERLRGLTDEEIETAVATDPDSGFVTDDEIRPLRGLIFRDSQGKWRWRLIAPDGRPIADSPGSYADRADVDRAIQALRDLITSHSARAA